jgi:hypothetical protein
MKKIIENALKNKQLIGVNTIDLEWDESIIGFIIKIDETSFDIHEIDEYGRLIGCTSLRFESIVKLEYGDRYQNRLAFLHENATSFDPNFRNTYWLESESLCERLNNAKLEKSIVTLFFDDNEYATGFIESVNENITMFKNVGSEGDEDGYSCFKTDNILGFRVNDLNEQRIKLLFENRSSFI